MNGWVYSQLLLDLILVGMIFYFLAQLRAERKGQEEKAARLKELHEDIANQIPQAERIFQRLQSEIANKETVLANLLAQIAEKEQEWQKLVTAFKVDESLPKDKGMALDFEKSQKYRLVNQLANEGLSIPEIAQKVDLPSGEIELVINLSKEVKPF